MAVCGRIPHFATSSMFDAKFRVAVKAGSNDSVQKAFQITPAQTGLPSGVHLSVTQ
jgi:hypothetical protein